MEIIITPEAMKQYRRLPTSEQLKIKKKLSILKQNPHEGKKLSGKLSEIRSLKVWPYRVIYYINDKKNKLFIVTIAHRQGVYK